MKLRELNNVVLSFKNVCITWFDGFDGLNNRILYEGPLSGSDVNGDNYEIVYIWPKADVLHILVWGELND